MSSQTWLPVHSFPLKNWTLSPIDDLGECAYESRWWWCQAKCEPQAGSAGIHGNPKSSYHRQVLSHWETQRSLSGDFWVENWETQWRYLPTSILPATKERKSKGKLPHKCTICSSKLHDLPERVCIIWKLGENLYVKEWPMICKHHWPAMAWL